MLIFTKNTNTIFEIKIIQLFKLLVLLLLLSTSHKNCIYFSEKHTIYNDEEIKKTDLPGDESEQASYIPFKSE